MDNYNDIASDDEFNDSAIELLALMMGVGKVAEFIHEVTLYIPESNDHLNNNKDKCLNSLNHLDRYLRRKSVEFDGEIEKAMDHPAYNSVRVKDMEVYPLEYPTGFNMPIDMPAGYPHSHNTDDWRPNLIGSEEIQDNVIDMFKYKDTTNKRDRS